MMVMMEELQVLTILVLLVEVGPLLQAEEEELEVREDTFGWNVQLIVRL